MFNRQIRLSQGGQCYLSRTKSATELLSSLESDHLLFSYISCLNQSYWARSLNKRLPCLISVLFWFKGVTTDMRLPLGTTMYQRAIPYNATEPLHQCDLCSYRSKRKGHLKRHMQEKHGPNEKIQCEFCHKVFKNERCFAQHGCFKNKAGTSGDPSMYNPASKDY